MDDENVNLNFEMHDLDEKLKSEMEFLIKLKEDYLNKKITYEDLIIKTKESVETSTNYRVLLNDIMNRIETGDDPLIS
jgi:hypothetical protein